MHLRLAFAVAAHLEPDVLVVDEVLAVGDAEFQRKCIGRMAEVEREGRTVVFVSHDLEALTRICRRALWLEAGRVRDSGDTHRIVRRYLASGLPMTASTTTSLRGGPVTVSSVRVRPADDALGDVLMRDSAFCIEVDFSLEEEVPGLDLTLYLTTQNGLKVFDEALSDHGSQRLAPGSYCARLEVPPVLNVGDFSVGLWMGTALQDLIHEPAIMTFTLGGADYDRPDRLLVLKPPFVVRPVVNVP
jgi:hypothetical protein